MAQFLLTRTATHALHSSLQTSALARCRSHVSRAYHSLRHSHSHSYSQLARVTPFIHSPKSLFATSIYCSQTLSLPHFSTDTSVFSRRPVTLPEDLSRNVIVLSFESSAEGGVCHVYLVGTCHFSKVLVLVVRNQESCRKVQAIMNFLKPQAVFLELCSSRDSVLTQKNLKVPTATEIATLLKTDHNKFEVLCRWFLAQAGFWTICVSSFNSEVDVLPGYEFRVAYEEAIKYGGRVILGDRPFEVKAMDDNDVVNRVLQAMSKEFPALADTIVHERDQYMSSTLLKVARENSSVVAVVGKAHLEGIKKHWKQPVVVGEHLVIYGGSHDSSMSYISNKNLDISRRCCGWGGHYIGHLSVPYSWSPPGRDSPVLPASPLNSSTHPQFHPRMHANRNRYQALTSMKLCEHCVDPLPLQMEIRGLR
ncbi:hypothetical protein VNO80_25084 [Phaseolus coccineus]|uniref:TraB domain-containing protein n=1 Tax=Phaseolus coccineus TaxID=3886 RepID=A0AAN9QPT5_PHACN